MSEYEHGNEELSKNQGHYYIPYDVSTEAGKVLFTKMNQQHGSAVWGAVGEGIAAVEAELQDRTFDEKGKSYTQGQQDLYNWMDETIQDWYAMKIVNDGQMLWLKELLHEVDKQVNYELKGENK